MPQGNIDNLISNDARSPDELRANAAKGGRKSGETRRRKRQMKEIAKELLAMDVTSDKAKQQMKAYGLKDDELTNNMAIMIAMLNKAVKGDVKAAQFIRDTMGEGPQGDQLKQRQKEFKKTIELKERELKLKEEEHW